MGAAIALVVLVVYPITEIAVATWLAGEVGWGWTLALLAAGLAVGILIMRSAGASALRVLTTASRTGALPGGEVGDHALTFLGGLLIAVPGFVTDVLGLLLVLPPTRLLIRRIAGRALRRRVRAAGFTVVQTTGPDGSPVTGVVDGDVIRGEVLDRHDEPTAGNPPRPPSPGSEGPTPRPGSHGPAPRSGSAERPPPEPLPPASS